MAFFPNGIWCQTFVVIEEDQLHDEADSREHGTAAQVAEHGVGQAKAHKIREGLPGDGLGDGPLGRARVRLHFFTLRTGLRRTP